MNRIKILAIILAILVVGLLIMVVPNLNKKFNKPSFDSNAKKISDNTNYIDKVFTIKDGYSFYIDGNPKLDGNNLFIDFYSNTSDDIYLKVRVLEDDKIIGESGLVQTGELLDHIHLNKTKVSGKVYYLIMGYEKDTYYSAGEVNLNIKIGDSNE